MRPWFAAVLGAALAVACLVVAGSSASIPTVGCSSIIDPDDDSARDWRPTRIVLGVVDVPPAYISQTSPSGRSRWPYWIKSGMVVRADSPPVVVSVAPRFRSRAAIAWGGTHPSASLRFPTCAASSTLDGWNPWAGGFYLKTRASCVPLVFRVGERTATVRFGIGKRCG